MTFSIPKDFFFVCHRKISRIFTLKKKAAVTAETVDEQGVAQKEKKNLIILVKYVKNQAKTMVDLSNKNISGKTS